MIERKRLEKDRQYEDSIPFVFDAGNDGKVKYVSVPRASTQTSFKAALRKYNFCWTNAVRPCPLMKSKICAIGIVTCFYSLKE